MEKQPEELKVVHSQHARILKQDEEVWISSEDLNTENSSDEDKTKIRNAFKKRLKMKDRKRSSPNIRLQRPSIPSVPTTSSILDDRLLMPSADDLNSRSTDDSRTSEDEEYQKPPVSAECLSKRLSLEDWRPMKGALKISSLEETNSAAGDARKIVNETGNFCDAMLDKLKYLKSCSVPKSIENENPGNEGKTFAHLKNTPEVEQQLDFINKLDEEISETIGLYKSEREIRLATEFEMCKTLSEQKLSIERDTETFLRMCNFEEKLKNFKEQAQDNDLQNEDIDDTELENDSVEIEEKFSRPRPTNFVRKNAFAAKEGLMAGLSLTDEEKAQIAEILKDIDDFSMDDVDLSASSASITDLSETKMDPNNSVATNKLERDNLNAFCFSESDKLRMDELDCELEKFTESCQSLKQSSNKVPIIKNEEFWKKYILDKSLKEIDSKLEELYVSYVEDEEKLKNIFCENNVEEDLIELDVIKNEN